MQHKLVLVLISELVLPSSFNVYSSGCDTVYDRVPRCVFQHYQICLFVWTLTTFRKSPKRGDVCSFKRGERRTMTQEGDCVTVSTVMAADMLRCYGRRVPSCMEQLARLSQMCTSPFVKNPHKVFVNICLNHLCCFVHTCLPTVLVVG